MSKQQLHRCLIVAVFTPGAIGNAALIEDVVDVPVTVQTIHKQTVSQNIKVTIWRDDRREKAPFLVLNHGRPPTAAALPQMGRQRYSDNSRYFVSKGFVVLVPTRVGYGPTGGTDVEYTGTCQAKMYAPAYKAAAEQTLALLNYARQLAFVDSSRGLVVGQSFGGATAIALASHNVEGVVGAVNFAGGGGGNPDTSPGSPCRPDLLERMFSDYGRTARIPTLWFYSENDRYFGHVLPKKWFDGFIASGGTGTFILLPPYKDDGHASFTGNPGAWKPAFEDFLRQTGF